jgi:hypothetical protein
MIRRRGRDSRFSLTRCLGGAGLTLLFVGAGQETAVEAQHRRHSKGSEALPLVSRLAVRSAFAE